MKHGIITLLLFICLASCYSKKRINEIKGAKFWDGITFISSEMLTTSYSYEFERKTYQLSARSTYDNDIKDFIVEKGTFKVRNNKIELQPQVKLMFDIGRLGEQDLILSYETVGYIENPKFTSIDSLSTRQISNLGFMQRTLEVLINNDVMVLKEINGNRTFKKLSSNH